MFKWKFILLINFIILLPLLVFAQSGRKQVLEGNKLFLEEKYDEANNKYRDALVNNPENPVIHFNIGNAQYKKKKFEEAIKDFEKSISADDINMQAQAYYNMGNTLYRMNKLPESILMYTQSLKLNPEDEDAKYNLEFVRAKLKDQAQKQKNQQQDQQQQEQQQQQQNKEQDQKEQEDQQKKQEHNHRLVLSRLCSRSQA
ncbi:hypothetical protein B6I21_08585 [candidate division KSB1 bacterium 4572_119]|nr:MAG: hypothetical protein B6I21_08585 [candidate division KSB1 bacterium 4572_119]